MSPVIPFLFFSSLVTVSHAAFLLFAKARLHQDREVRLLWWNRHLLFNGILWLIVFAWLLLLQRMLPHEATAPFARSIGWTLLTIGMVLIIWSRILLGRNQAMGIRFFLPDRSHVIMSGLYHLLNNPMYDGFLFVLVGLGLALGVREDFYIAGVSFLLLNILLARIENPKTSLHPF